MTNTEVIRIALSFLLANITEAQDALDIDLDYNKIVELEKEYYEN